MAVPADFTILDISGKFCMNKQLTNVDDTDKILGLQGVGWLKRKAIRYATITLDIKHYRVDSDDGTKKIEKIDIVQTLTGGIPGTTENRTLTWEERENNDDLFGPVIGKSRRVKAEELEDEWLKEGWTEDTYEHGVIEAYAKSDTPKSKTTWVGDQTWGIELIDGKRMYARHVNFTGPKGEKVKTKMYYDYIGPLD
ncbi:hypothetical protein Agabi119p4_787 [Agaricus bisporus var. burnettii]|uniref:Uncharacterized protein n=1 Tax=Agaricus bisporus var. burnettii TaxID=192524 RepID=A0A8H7FBA3_AGABI|nr:hypothetical protein Agabi119p4_787 [Agaricus bisporus var. burnettii]